MKQKDHGSLRQKLHTVIFGTDTPAGKRFDVVLLWAILLSVMAVMMESVKAIYQEFGTLLRYVEWFFTILFTLEYVLRLLIVPNPRKYALSFLGIIDLLAVLPTYLSLIAPGGSVLVVIRAVRLLRVFRILKLTRYIQEAQVLVTALKSSRQKILVFMGAATTIVVITGTIMYVIEGGRNGFTSVPSSIYWAIVTVTTVGYGDITPTTYLGKAFAAVLMLLGYAIIAVPTGIVSNELSKTERKMARAYHCPDCNYQESIAEARHCRNCGSRLPDDHLHIKKETSPTAGEGVTE